MHFYLCITVGASLVVQKVKHLLAMRETWVPSLGQEDPLEKEMATHSSILAWRIPWAEEPGELQSMGSQSQTQLSDLSTHANSIDLSLNFEYGHRLAKQLSLRLLNEHRLWANESIIEQRQSEGLKRWKAACSEAEW